MDGHMHTPLCNHAVGTMEEYVQAALAARLHTICFLEHLEAGINYEKKIWLNEDDFALYFAEGNWLKKKYSGQLNILLGVETGYNPEEKEELNRMLAAFPWDRVGLSLHFIKFEGRHHNLLTRDKAGIDKLVAQGREEILNWYYATLIEALHVIPCDVVCHLDVVLRSVPDIEPLKGQMSQVAQLLDIMAENNIALEVNTSGFAHRQEPFPGYAVITMAKKKGIKLQLGSDAHNPIQVGRHFEEVCSKIMP